MPRIIFYLFVAIVMFCVGIFIVTEISNEKSQNISILFKNIKKQNEVSQFFNTELTFDTPNLKTNEDKFVGRGFGSGNNEPNKLINLRKSNKPTCSDKKLLPVWNELVKDQHFKESGVDFYMYPDCLQMLDVQKLDLNDDGQKEIILWGKNGDLCGGHYGCDFWVYEKKKGNYKLLLQFNAYNDGTSKWLKLGNKKNRKYRNVVLEGEGSGYTKTTYTFKFDGQKYKEIDCLHKDYFPDEQNPTIKTCKEAWGN